ncbi:U3 small nucleolar ribonucleoprotein IMP3, putative [Entamoeba invadens IP1]|uniref:U3 small nucleolar ribonucleoprotein IMP3, putative n=1 Tax=Entamoeba invadens IP1 TaxID=370355 RepID=UPI0002C3F9BC|nr:U3 small nucleolar ribonucleoprotein IMP3, putative [Entamoeba invadens IP1]ELP93847.1 U3 small nucleolar ribonucleoprotein IMP3, putative [Entamoeba invadens IP1]|eukprot:XP_004260618.1 U3 small nucleolar ribonucleoprotein IMP3, putative [Entamoeba invadens IP1]
MVRKLKYHEEKLMKKTDFINWKLDNGPLKAAIMRKYFIHSEKEYGSYLQVSYAIVALAKSIAKLPKTDEFRMVLTRRLCDALFDLGVIDLKEQGLSALDKLTASSFAERRLAVIMQRRKMVDTIQMGDTMITHGHVKVGPDIIRNPAFLISRTKEDYVSWDDQSKMRKKINEFNDAVDDYDIEDA